MTRMDMASLWYLRLFRRHLLLMHVVHISVTLALWVVMWRMVGTTVTLWLVGAWLFLSILSAAAAWISRSRSSP
jgi:hypothetical protein